MTLQDMAKELKLDWHAVKALDMEDMAEQLRRNPVAAPRAIGVDEVSIRKRHTYRIAVSDLVRKRPIWFGGEDRSEASLDRKIRVIQRRSYGLRDEEYLRLTILTCMLKAF